MLSSRKKGRLSLGASSCGMHESALLSVAFRECPLMSGAILGAGTHLEIDGLDVAANHRWNPE